MCLNGFVILLIVMGLSCVLFVIIFLELLIKMFSVNIDLLVVINEC